MNSYDYFGNATDEQKQYADAHFYRHTVEDMQTAINQAYVALEEKEAVIPAEKTVENLAPTIRTISGINNDVQDMINNACKANYDYTYGITIINDPNKVKYVTRIVDYAFQDCGNLPAVITFPNVTEVGTNIFQYANINGKELHLPKVTGEYIAANVQSWVGDVWEQTSITVHGADGYVHTFEFAPQS